jgi:hypothetical protein
MATAALGSYAVTDTSNHISIPAILAANEPKYIFFYLHALGILEK